MRLKAADHCSPVAEVECARKYEIPGAGEKITGHCKHQEVAHCGLIRSAQKYPENRTEEKIHQGAIRRDPSCLDIALQRHCAQSNTVGAAKPRGHSMAKAFVKNVLQYASEYRQSNQGQLVILDFHSIRYWRVSHAGKASGSWRF
jgi:hypothetical protein